MATGHARRTRGQWWSFTTDFRLSKDATTRPRRSSFGALFTHVDDRSSSPTPRSHQEPRPGKYRALVAQRLFSRGLRRKSSGQQLPPGKAQCRGTLSAPAPGLLGPKRESNRALQRLQLLHAPRAICDLRGMHEPSGPHSPRRHLQAVSKESLKSPPFFRREGSLSLSSNANPALRSDPA